MQNNNLKRKLNLWTPVFLWALVIFAFSEIPTVPMSRVTWQEFVIKKSAHVIEFGVLAAFLYRAFLGSGTGKKNAFRISLLTSIVYGVLDEVHQRFTPGRTSTIRDVLFDTMGALIGLFFVRRFLPQIKGSGRVLRAVYKFVYEKKDSD
jgi:VanZ family protein